MKTKSFILAAILAIHSTIATTIESAFAQSQNPVGRSYILPANPSISAAFLEDSNGDSINDLLVIKFPKPRFEFSILSQLNNQSIIDRDDDPNIGFFPNAISSFTYIEDTQTTSERLKDDRGNFFPSTQVKEIIQQIIPERSEIFFDGDLRVEQVNNSGIIYEFNFTTESIQFLLPEVVSTSLDPFLAINDLDYIVNQNLFAQESVIDNLFISETSFIVNGFDFRGNQPESSLIFASQSVPEPNNLISFLILGLLGKKLLTKDKTKLN